MIGTRNETSLHSQLKEHYYLPGDILEGQIGNYVVDLVQPKRLVEIQTGNFSALRVKLPQLLKDHAVLLVYPIAVERYLVQVAPDTGEVLGRRKSPKKGTVYDLFSELIRIPSLLLNPNLTVETVLTVQEELRCADGLGSWRRRGVSILDRLLVEILDQRTFGSSRDYLSLLPQELPPIFSNRELAAEAGIPVRQARKVTYTLKKSGLIRETGKRGNELLHTRNEQ